MIQHTLQELRNLLDTDDDLALERSWIIRETAYTGECTVIRRELATQIQEQDPEGVVIKVIAYAVDLFGYSEYLRNEREIYIPNKTKSTGVYTAWTPITWRESLECARLSKYETSTWRLNLKKKELCITQADSLAEKMSKIYGPKNKEHFFKQVILAAERSGWNPEQVEKFVKEVLEHLMP